MQSPHCYDSIYPVEEERVYDQIVVCNNDIRYPYESTRQNTNIHHASRSPPTQCKIRCSVPKSSNVTRYHII